MNPISGALYTFVLTALLMFSLLTPCQNADSVNSIVMSMYNNRNLKNGIQQAITRKLTVKFQIKKSMRTLIFRIMCVAILYKNFYNNYSLFGY